MNFLRLLILIKVVLVSYSLASTQVYGNMNVQQGNKRYELQRQPIQHSVNPMSGGTIMIEARGLINVEPDGFVAIFNVKQRDKTVEGTEQALQQRIAKFKSALSGQQVAVEDIHIDMLSMLPIFEYEEYKKFLSSKKYIEVPSGFELQQNIHVRYTDANMLAKIVSAAAQSGIYDLAAVTPFVNDIEAIYAELRDRSRKVIETKEKHYATMGMQVDTLFRTVTESRSVVYPDQSYSQYQPALTINRFDAESKENKVETIYKPFTPFYDPQRIDKFDFVINPELLEPSMQFSYHMQLMYWMKPVDNFNKPRIVKETDIQKEYYLLSPNGDLKLIKLGK